MKQFSAPFLPWQVDLLNQFQVGANSPVRGHPFTCPHRGELPHGTEGGDLGVLIAKAQGWVCPHCSYTQDWAHESMITQLPTDIEKLPADFEALATFTKIGGDDPFKDPYKVMLERTERAILNYQKLYQSRKTSIDKSPEDTAVSMRIWCSASVMLHGLCKHRSVLMDAIKNAPPPENSALKGIESVQDVGF